MKFVIKKQPNSIACGPTCIEMVLHAFGELVSFKDIEKLSGYKKTDGMTDKQIADTFEKIGYKAEVKINTSWEQVKEFLKEGCAVVVSWMKDGYKGHVSVVTKINNNHIFLADPDIGREIKIEKIKFMRLWMEYDGHWWPEKVTDIHLRTIIRIKNK